MPSNKDFVKSDGDISRSQSILKSQNEVNTVVQSRTQEDLKQALNKLNSRDHSLISSIERTRLTKSIRNSMGGSLTNFSSQITPGGGFPFSKERPKYRKGSDDYCSETPGNGSNNIVRMSLPVGFYN
jgi:hypothetical protein